MLHESLDDKFFEKAAMTQKKENIKTTKTSPWPRSLELTVTYLPWR